MILLKIIVFNQIINQNQIMNLLLIMINRQKLMKIQIKIYQINKLIKFNLIKIKIQLKNFIYINDGYG